MAAGTAQSSQCRLSLTTIGLPLLPSRSLPLTKGYSLSHGLRGAPNQTTHSPTNHKAPAGWCNHSHTDLSTQRHTHTHTRAHPMHTHAHTHPPWEACTPEQTQRRRVIHRHRQLFQSPLRALCLGFFLDLDAWRIIWEGRGAERSSWGRKEREEGEGKVCCFSCLQVF